MDKLILLDAGHGIDTPGKRSPIWDDYEQLFEWEFNRDLARLIASECEALDIDVVRVVTESYDVPLSERCKRINALARERDCILFSIHANAGGGTGFEVFTTKGETGADAIATGLIAQLEKDFPEIKMRKDFSDGDPDKEADFYILKHTICPAVLVENLFMDNESDCRLLLDGEFRANLALSYVEYIKTLVR